MDAELLTKKSKNHGNIILGSLFETHPFVALS